jgi:hypothetical protein
VVMRKHALSLFEIELQDYKRRCLLWLGITAAAFLSGSFWLLSLVAG